LEQRRIELAIAHRLDVRQVHVDRRVDLFRPADELDPHAHRLGIVKEFLTHAERQHDQRMATGAALDLPHQLQLRASLVQPKAGEQRTPAAFQHPGHDRFDVRLQPGMKIGRIDVKAVMRSQLDFGFQEVAIIRRADVDTHAATS
jgi:hypothetical protein